ncbi:metalloregulator ArsR/SmtB family transcription factor [Sphaerisporangium rubeum]|uniref:DNA-binding transcriptional ArsR family regulator n=1 Tax=Sphaerisporangium rubeum TaxID=321317 RepID=A0A7X0IGN1_9ACTN|nr:DNA-binding transcriptional ArsR family regulator [Sphaerisporangium rubeum]
MKASAAVAGSPTEIFKALGDPIRWEIIRQMAEVDELACSTLEETLPVSKPTISYHTKILTQAGLVHVRKEGRNYYYTLRQDVLNEIMDHVWALAPAPRPVREGRIDHESEAVKRRRTTRRRLASAPAVAAAPAVATSGGEPVERDAVLLTW